MKDREWCKRIEDEITGLKDRLKKLECCSGSEGPAQKIIELDIEWPEADISGLHFNAQKTHSVFDLKEDGNYYSRDILFLSARDTDDGTGRELLSEYLDSDTVKKTFLAAIDNYTAHTDTIRVFIPDENNGVKKYNGVSWWYWLRRRSAASSAYFANIGGYGITSGGNASGVDGCAPAFCVGENRHG